MAHGNNAKACSFSLKPVDEILDYTKSLLCANYPPEC